MCLKHVEHIWCSQQAALQLKGVDSTTVDRGGVGFLGEKGVSATIAGMFFSLVVGGEGVVLREYGGRVALSEFATDCRSI